MDVYVARQPIFDRNMDVYGYELLYRRSKKNIYEGIDDNQATASVIHNAFLSMHFEELTGRTKAFINFSNDMLIGEIPLLLPNESVVVEVLETVEINDELIAACQKLRDEGYIIALDDFHFHPSFIPLLELAHIVKLEFPKVNMDLQKALIEKYKHKIKFLAEKIETREEYQLALDMGYDYFQGYFFSKPVVIHSKDIKSLNVNHIQILAELENKEINFEKLDSIIQGDIGLSYKLLKLANSALLGTSTKITSIKQALVRIGTKEIRKWIYLLILQTTETVENRELLRTCLIRGRFMEQLAIEIGQYEQKTSYFLTGAFSEIDNILNRDMDEVLDELALSTEVKDALLGEDNTIKEMLDKVIGFESHTIWTVSKNKVGKLAPERVMETYIEALSWAVEAGYN